MKPFCHQCGATGVELRGGLCPGCFTRRARLVEPPPRLEVAHCPRCDSVLQRKKWTPGPLEQALPRLAAQAIRPRPEANRLHVEATPTLQDPYMGRVSWVATGEMEGLRVRTEGEFPLRVLERVCERCTRVSGRYHEALIQVRADRRPLTPTEKTQTLARAMEPLRADEKREGIDLYYETARQAEKAARSIQGSLGGERTTTSKIAGRRDGADIWRVTISLRLPRHQRGDILQTGEHTVLLRGYRDHRPRLVRLDTGAPATGDITDATPLASLADARPTTVVILTPREVHLLDPDTQKTAILPRPPYPVEHLAQGDEVKVIPTPRGLILDPSFFLDSSLRSESRKKEKTRQGLPRT